MIWLHITDDVHHRVVAHRVVFEYDWRKQADTWIAGWHIHKDRARRLGHKQRQNINSVLAHSAASHLDSDRILPWCHYHWDGQPVEAKGHLSHLQGALLAHARCHPMTRSCTSASSRRNGRRIGGFLPPPPSRPSSVSMSSRRCRPEGCALCSCRRSARRRRACCTLGSRPCPSRCSRWTRACGTDVQVYALVEVGLVLSPPGGWG